MTLSSHIVTVSTDNHDSQFNVTGSGADQVAQQVEVLAAKPHDLILIPELGMVEGENRLPRVVL